MAVRQAKVPGLPVRASENRSYARPHFRLEKSGRVINKLSRGRVLDLLDVGCRPATLQNHLAGAIRYHGLDIAVHEPAPNLIELDLMENPIEFRGMRFDLIIQRGIYWPYNNVQRPAEFRKKPEPAIQCCPVLPGIAQLAAQRTRPAAYSGAPDAHEREYPGDQPEARG